jgi:hypothetical protein
MRFLRAPRNSPNGPARRQNGGERVLQSRSRRSAPFHNTTILRQWQQPQAHPGADRRCGAGDSNYSVIVTTCIVPRLARPFSSLASSTPPAARIFVISAGSKVRKSCVPTAGVLSSTRYPSRSRIAVDKNSLARPIVVDFGCRRAAYFAFNVRGASQPR